MHNASPTVSRGSTRSSDLEHQIQLYRDQHRLGEAMKSEELAQLQGLQRALALRGRGICGQFAYIQDAASLRAEVRRIAPAPVSAGDAHGQ